MTGKQQPESLSRPEAEEHGHGLARQRNTYRRATGEHDNQIKRPFGVPRFERADHKP